MLQRAAGCAYSWWWASHIRTKQGKWLEQSLQEMEEKVKNILLVIEEDADSFAKRAEMYYKKRPELISFVEESYRAYRALAERYNHISKELQTANSTIATVFPEQVQISVEEEDDVSNQQKASSTNPGKAPKTPEIPKLRLPTKHSKEPPIKPKKAQVEKPNLSMSKDEAQEEIDKLQKGILVLQTEKEFVKCSYESGLTKYWEIENQIEEMQENVCKLQDDYSVSQVIEDNEARALITASVLKTCEDTLLQLQEQQKRSVEEARTEEERIKIAKEKLKAFKDGAFKDGFLQNPTEDCELPEECKIEDSTDKNLVEESSHLKQEKLELQSLSEKIREYFEVNSDSSLTVLELAEKVDELVNKVLSLETAVSSQTALIERLRTETDELQKHLQCLEEEKLSSIDGSKDLNDKIQELEEKFNGIQDLNQSVADESNKLQTHLTEVCCNLDDLSEELQPPKQHDEIETMGAPQLEESVLLDLEPQKQIEKEEEMMVQFDSPSDSMGEMVEQAEMQKTQDQENPIQSGNFQKLQLLDEVKNKQPSEEDNVLNAGGDSPNWQQLFLNGLEDKEKMLLTEYTTILRNYKEMKKRLSEMETRNQESLLEMTAQIAELTSSNAMKDIEIQSLRQKLNILQKNSDEKMDAHISKSKESIHDRAGNTIDQWKSLFSGLQKKSNMRPLEELLREQSIGSPPRLDELRAFASRDNSLTEEIVLPLINEQHAASKVEEKFRRDIDSLLEENLEFWLRFSTSFQQIQKFQTAVQGIQTDLLKPKNYGKKQEGGTNAVDQVRKSKATSIEKHLREVQMEMSVWVEQNASLKDELKCRFTSLCKVQEEIPRALKEHSEAEKSEFTAHQAAKFQGEVLNMQKENNKVAEELEAGLKHVQGLQFQVEKTLSKLHQNFEQTESKSHHHSSTWQSTSRAKIPLRSFIFGIKPKKTSLFSCVNPALQKQSSDLKTAGAGPPI